MTYRDISNLCEMARVLSYPRLISMENFRQPNFRLVAELMTWLVKQYDPQADVPQDFDGEQERVIFIRTVGQIIAVKAHMKLNTKKLYQADGYAVKEILKVITPLYQALRESENKELEDEEDIDHQYRYAMNDDIGTLKSARALCSTITLKGANLHELLGKEIDAREARQNVMNRAMELSQVEEAIKEAEVAAKREIAKTKKLIENVETDEVALDEKIAKRLEERERYQRRLDMLKSVKPSFMTDFEKFENELNDLYSNYVLKFRILSYLEKELEGHFKNQREKEVSRPYMQSMHPQLTEQEQQRFNRQLQDPTDEIGVHSDDDEDDDDDQSDDDDEENSDDDDLVDDRRMRGNPRGGNPRKGYGGMTDDLSDGDEPPGQQGGELDDDEDDDDDLAGEMDPRQRAPIARAHRRNKQQGQSRSNHDDDENF